MQNQDKLHLAVVLTAMVAFMAWWVYDGHQYEKDLAADAAYERSGITQQAVVK